MPILALLIAIVIVAFLFIGGGSDKPVPTLNPADAKATVKKAGNDLLLGQIRQQLQYYKSEHGAYPESLDKLPIEIPVDVSLDYNAVTGEVTPAAH